MAQDDFLSFVERIKQAESLGKRYGKDGKLLTSPKGAQGEMQVMPGTQRAPGFGITPIRDDSPDEIARVGRDLLKALNGYYGGNKMHAAAAYNWGKSNVDKWIAKGADFNQLPKETQGYLRRVTPESLPASVTSSPAKASGKSAEAQYLPELPPITDGQTKVAQAAAPQPSTSKLTPVPTPTPVAAAAPAARAEDLGSGYKAALALSFLGSEDKDRPTSDSELEDRLNETALAEFNKELEDYTPKNALADVELTALNPAKFMQPVKMADGGEVDKADSDAKEMLRRFDAQGMAGSGDRGTMAGGKFGYTHPLDDETKLKLELMGHYVSGPGFKNSGVDAGNVVYEKQLDKDSSIRAMLGAARGKGVNRGSLTYSRRFADGGEVADEPMASKMLKAIVPMDSRIFGSTLFGSRDPITEKNFNAEELAAMQQAVDQATKRTGKAQKGAVDYVDYPRGEQIGPGFQPVGQTLGRFVYEKQPDGTTVIRDRYDFYNEGRKANVESYEKMGTGEKALTVSGRMLKNLVTGNLRDIPGEVADAYIGREGRDVTIKLPPVKRAGGSPETGEVAPTPEELAAASSPAFLTPKSGIGRKTSTKPGEIEGAVLQGVTETPYNLLGAPVDLATMAMRPFGYDVKAPVGGSDWIKEKMTSLGVRPETPTQPTQRAFYELGQLGAGVVNPAAPVRGAVKAAEAVKESGKAAQMLESMKNIPVGASTKQVEPIFQHIPTKEAPFVGRLDEFVANMSTPVQKEQFLGMLKGKFRDYDIQRAQEALADFSPNTKLAPQDLLARIKSIYDPGRFNTSVAPPGKYGFNYASVDNIYLGKPLGVIHLAQEVPAETKALQSAADQMLTTLERVRQSADNGVFSSSSNRNLKQLATNPAVPVSDEVRQRISALVDIYPAAANDVNSLRSIQTLLLKTEASPDFMPAVKKSAEALKRSFPDLSDLQRQYMAMPTIAEQLYQKGYKNLLDLSKKYGIDVPAEDLLVKKPDFDSRLVGSYYDSSLTYSTPGTLSPEAKFIYDVTNTQLQLIQRKIAQPFNDAVNFAKVEVEHMLPYTGQHSNLAGSPLNPVAFSRFSEHTTDIPGMGKVNGIYVNELQSDLLEHLQEFGARGGSLKKDRGILKDLNNQIGEINKKTRDASDAGNDALVNSLLAERTSLMSKADSLLRRIQGASTGEGSINPRYPDFYHTQQPFANTERSPQALQQLMAKNAIAGAIQQGKQFVAFPGKESAQAQLYEKLPNNLKQVVKDLGPGFELRDVTLTTSVGDPILHRAVVWGPEAAARLQKKGVPFKSGGMVERQSTDNRAYL